MRHGCGDEVVRDACGEVEGSKKRFRNSRKACFLNGDW